MIKPMTFLLFLVLWTHKMEMEVRGLKLIFKTSLFVIISFQAKTKTKIGMFEPSHRSALIVRFSRRGKISKLPRVLARPSNTNSLPPMENISIKEIKDISIRKSQWKILILLFYNPSKFKINQLAPFPLVRKKIELRLIETENCLNEQCRFCEV